MKNVYINKNILAGSVLIAGLAGAFISTAQAQVTWTGGGADDNWNTAANWSGGAVPGNDATVSISNGDTVVNDRANGVLPRRMALTLSGGSSLSSGGNVIRLVGSTITVESGSSLTGGGFWDLGDATINFKDGASVNMGSWEQKDTNVFNFELSASGFTTLTPGTFRLGDGGLTRNIANATYTVDMTAYNGDAGTIVLADFASDAAGMDNATFQGAGGLNIVNAGAFTGSYLQWNDTTEAIELVVVPEPSAYALLGGCLALGAVLLRRRQRG